MTVDLDGAVVIVTGASRGIGRAVAKAVAARGATVGLIARSATDLEAVLASIAGKGATAIADVTDRPAVEAAIAHLEGSLGPVDGLVNNAGIGKYASVLDTTVEEFERLMQVNYFGALYATKAVLPGMVSRQRGHIVNVSSIVGRIGTPFEAGYSASKFAMTGLSEALAIEIAPFNIGVSMVSPGPVDTDFFDTRGVPYDRSFPKPVSAERIADAVVAAIEHNKREQLIPRWFRQALVFKTLAPPLFYRGTSRSLRKELAELVAGTKRDSTN
jgi:3-oxoacyl-[acyl-carrier protein] reductase